MEEDKNRHDLATLDMVNLRFLRFFGVVLPRNDFWLRRHILWRIRWRYSRSLQFYWRVLLCNVLFIFSALRHKLSLDFSLFSPFSYVELTFVITAIRSSENGWRVRKSCRSSWSPYSPNLNLIERLCKFLRKTLISMRICQKTQPIK